MAKKAKKKPRWTIKRMEEWVDEVAIEAYGEFGDEEMAAGEVAVLAALKELKKLRKNKKKGQG